ncbi:MAG: hypothetical protein AABZ06_13020 [Bdellovibrionota bacterium]
MGKSTVTRRFPINPMEGVIFALFVALFARSVYNLFYERQSFISPTPQMTLTTISSESRAPAGSVPQSFLNIDVSCNSPLVEQNTGAVKARLSGQLCGSIQGLDASKLAKTSAVNGSNKFIATIFTDIGGGKYSTDYIPLNLGKNPIHVEFTYKDGKIVAQDVNLTRN